MGKINIAIDGPAGAGKSTVAKAIANKLGIIHLDTGTMYRAAALAALRKGVSPLDEEAVAAMLPIDIDVQYKEGAQRVLLEGEDVTEAIREHAISQAASDISRIKQVRLMLAELQRKIAEKNDVVMDGRDIGTFVLPGADYKFYLTAAPEVRAKRRLNQLKEMDQNGDYEEILKSIIARDENDIKREFAPLKKAEDAILIDSTYMSVEEVVQTILSEIK
ncbi:MAG: (d)CMP kinase [Clostridiales bacterium]|jgi:cytidylate kinase|nr:(d)CMP kinase [Clostridiales bacterium]